MHLKRCCITGFFFTALMWPMASTQAKTSGGFFEKSDTSTVRPVLTAAQLGSIVPERGAFKFPAPYHTDAFRITNASDCAGGDCVNDAGYAYWRNINNHVGMPSMLLFLGLDRSRGGRGPSLYELDKNSGRVTDLGALFPSGHRLSWASGEGWYFSATQPVTLYLNDGPRLVRYDVITGQMQTVFDIAQLLGSGYTIAQMHSSDDDSVHSATVRDAANYRALGCVAFDERTRRLHHYPISADYDECQIDRSGKWLLIKANLDGLQGEDNRIINLQTGQERIISDSQGAAGHSDMGHGYMVAADNWAADANTWKLWDFNAPVLAGKRVYHNRNWNVFAPAHVSHTNARGDVAPGQQYACGSSVNRVNSTHANEIVCFMLDGSSDVLVVAPTMTSLDAPGGGDDYRRFAKGNLDVTGRYFFWTSNMGGGRLDAFVVRIPDQVATEPVRQPAPQPQEPVPAVPAEPVPTEPVATDPEVPVAPTTPVVGGDILPDAVLWQSQRNVSLTSRQIRKISGCDGCADAGAVSLQQLAQGNGRLDFTVGSSQPLLFAGFVTSPSLPGTNDLVFALRLQNGIAEVRERGRYRADTRFNPGDRFSIAIDNGKVHYAQNGSIFHTSTVAIPYPLFGGVLMHNVQAELDNMVMVVNSAPAIRDISTGAVSATELELSWTTDQPAESLVQYGTDENYTQQSAHETRLQSSHRVRLGNNQPGSTVHMRILTRNAAGDISSTGNMSVVMPR